MKNGNFRLDMAEESADFLKIDVKTAQKRVGENVTVRVTCVQKDEESRALNRDKGKYITVDAEKNVAYPSVKRDVTAAVKDAIRNLSSKAFRERPRVLVAGLGNRYVAADAIGPKTADNIETAGKTEMYALSTGIYAMTGLESATIIRAVARETKANLVIVVDTLATANLCEFSEVFSLLTRGSNRAARLRRGATKSTLKAWVYPSLQSASRRAFTQGKSCSIHLKNRAD